MLPAAPGYVIPGTAITLEPGTWGVSHGSGWLGQQIRRCEQRMGANHEAAWAGHAFRYVGPQRLVNGGPLVPAIVEAEWPKVKLSPVTAHRDAIWAVGEPYTPAQRATVVTDTLALCGLHYDPLVYGWFLAKAFGMAVTGDLGPLFKDPRILICSGTVAVGERDVGAAGLAALALSATSDPNVISPADLLRWGLNCGTAGPIAGKPTGWMHEPVPAWT